MTKPIEPERVRAAIRVAELCLLRRDRNPLYDHEAWERAVESYEQISIRCQIAAAGCAELEDLDAAIELLRGSGTLSEP